MLADALMSRLLSSQMSQRFIRAKTPQPTYSRRRLACRAGEVMSSTRILSGELGCPDRLFRSDLGADLPSPSGDGDLLEFFEFVGDLVIPQL